MRHAWLIAILLAAPGVLAGQEAGVLRIRVVLTDNARQQTAVPRHALLISDAPPTAAPRRVVTSPAGTAEVRLKPGTYTVESDRPVVFLGKGYQWTQMVEVGPGSDTTLELTGANAEEVTVTAPTASPSSATNAPPESDPAFIFAKWQDSVVAVWSPTARASGFVVDAAGLIATTRHAVGDGTSVSVQFSPEVKVAGRVLFVDTADVAIVRVHPSVVAGREPLAPACPAAKSPSLTDGQEVMAIAMPQWRPTDQEWGEVTALTPRAVETDLRLGFGGDGGPVFNGAGDFAGLSASRVDADGFRSEVTIVRAGIVCEALVAARAKLTDAAPPDANRLPVEPIAPKANALQEPMRDDTSATTPPMISSSDFDVAFITPPMVQQGQLRADRTGGRSSRSPEVEARIGRLTDFGAWSGYFEVLPPVLTVRVSPKLVEGFWKRLAREAARTQGVPLPPFRNFTTSFRRLVATCGGSEVAPIHPFVIEHRFPGKDVVREGLYVFDRSAFGPHCGTVTLELYSEKAPEERETLAIEPRVIDAIAQPHPEPPC